MNDLPGVVTEVAIPGVSWLIWPSVPLCTVGVNNLPTVVLGNGKDIQPVPISQILSPNEQKNG